MSRRRGVRAGATKRLSNDGGSATIARPRAGSSTAMCKKSRPANGMLYTVSSVPTWSLGRSAGRPLREQPQSLAPQPFCGPWIQARHALAELSMDLQNSPTPVSSVKTIVARSLDCAARRVPEGCGEGRGGGGPQLRQLWPASRGGGGRIAGADTPTHSPAPAPAHQLNARNARRERRCTGDEFLKQGGTACQDRRDARQHHRTARRAVVGPVPPSTRPAQRRNVPQSIRVSRARLANALPPLARARFAPPACRPVVLGGLAAAGPLVVLGHLAHHKVGGKRHRHGDVYTLVRFGPRHGAVVAVAQGQQRRDLPLCGRVARGPRGAWRRWRGAPPSLEVAAHVGRGDRVAFHVRVDDGACGRVGTGHSPRAGHGQYYGRTRASSTLRSLPTP